MRKYTLIGFGVMVVYALGYTAGSYSGSVAYLRAVKRAGEGYGNVR